ncbi:MAG: hypothetical protein ACTHMS_23865 [Jatrophihabitans sp.]|uniref:hypothetical protein n=1 Tax=Jatrophihabitans sp. TaxID=1932789 RepID=UPI003F7F63C5
MTMDATLAPVTARPRRHLHAVAADGVAPVAPLVAIPTAAPRTTRRPIMERLRPHLPCRSDAAELRHALTTLGPSWRIVRGLADNGVHSLLVGPGGVFALTVQSLAHARVAVGGTTVTVDGRPVPLVPERRMVADNMARRISAAAGVEIVVRGVVAVIHAQPRWSFREQPADGRVVVLPGRDVAAFLAAQAPILTPSDVEAIAHAAANPAKPVRPALYAV